MTENPESRVAELLRETEGAHGVYETTVLDGERDEDWPTWYASYLLDHGLAGLLPGAIDLDPDQLATRLARYAAAYERDRPEWPWPEVYAQALVAELG
jgi:hypothetical protein